VWSVGSYRVVSKFQIRRKYLQIKGFLKQEHLREHFKEQEYEQQQVP
jgi:hypothetical protein